MNTRLPNQVKKQADKADELIKAITRQLSNHPRVGRPKKYALRETSVFLASSVDELDKIGKIAEAAIGPSSRGNKRRGMRAQYIDLVDYFLQLKKRGINLPRQHLSKAAATTELAQILIRHGHLRPDRIDALNDPVVRQKISHKLARVFIRIAEAVESFPPQ